MLLGLVTPTRGDVRLFGEEMPARAAAVLPGRRRARRGPGVPPVSLRPAQPAPARRRPTAPPTRRPRAPRVDALLSTGWACWPPPTSGSGPTASGMRQRLAIAGALLTPKDLLVLDEPTNGLDPQGTREVRQLVGSLASDGTTVLVSSHLLAEVEQMCTHLGVMHVGRLVAQGSSAELRSEGNTEATVETDAPHDAARVLAELGLTDIQTTASSATGHLGEVAPEKVVAACVHAGVAVRRLPGRPAVAGGRLRLADRGGLRCQWLRPPDDRRPRPAGDGLAAVPALRAPPDVRAPAQPGRPAGPRGRPGADRDRGQEHPVAAAARTPPTSSARSPRTGSSSPSPR